MQRFGNIFCAPSISKAKQINCSTVVNPDHIRAYTTGRLILLDKNPGVRPIGVGEVLRRIVGKSVTKILKPELVRSTAPIQVCAGLQSGVKAAIHAMRKIFQDPECMAVLLVVDANNAFNSLNRNVALHKLKYTCPEFYKYVANTYREPTNLYVSNSSETIISQECTTQSDTSAMGIYAESLIIPLIEKLKKHVCELLKQIFYADQGRI